MIIDSVKEKYNLTVNSSMISYVKDKIGICVKKKDRRYDPTQKNKRIPSPEQYKAIIDVMNQYRALWSIKNGDNIRISWDISKTLLYNKNNV